MFFVFQFFILRCSRGLSFNPGCMVFKWPICFEGFSAPLGSRSLHAMQGGVSVWESPVAINPYFNQDSWYCLLRAFCFFDVEGSCSVSLLRLFPFARKLYNDVCSVLILANLRVRFQRSNDRDVTWKIKGK